MLTVPTSATWWVVLSPRESSLPGSVLVVLVDEVDDVELELLLSSLPGSVLVVLVDEVDDVELELLLSSLPGSVLVVLDGESSEKLGANDASGMLSKPVAAATEPPIISNTTVADISVRRIEVNILESPGWVG